MRKLLLIISVFALCACAAPQQQNQPKETPVPSSEPVVLTLPEKEIADSTKMSESPITPKNIDDYLFREDCIYLDTRYPYQFYQEGSIAGFLNLPFYEYIADFNKEAGALFTITRVTKDDGSVILPGEPGSFIANYEESEELIKDIIPSNKNILVIATAGVESSYLLSLLIQLGYDPSTLYNVGSFTTGMGDDIAYRYYENAKHIVPPFELYETNIQYSWENLTKVSD